MVTRWGYTTWKRKNVADVGAQGAGDANKEQIGKPLRGGPVEGQVRLGWRRIHFTSELEARTTEKPSFKASSVMRTTKS